MNEPAVTDELDPAFRKIGYCRQCRRYYTAQYFNPDEYVAKNPAFFKDEPKRFIEQQKKIFASWLQDRGATVCDKEQCKKACIFTEVDRRPSRRPSQARLRFLDDKQESPQ